MKTRRPESAARSDGLQEKPPSSAAANAHCAAVDCRRRVPGRAHLLPGERNLAGRGNRGRRARRGVHFRIGVSAQFERRRPRQSGRWAARTETGRIARRPVRPMVASSMRCRKLPASCVSFRKNSPAIGRSTGSRSTSSGLEPPPRPRRATTWLPFAVTVRRFATSCGSSAIIGRPSIALAITDSRRSRQEILNHKGHEEHEEEMQMHDEPDTESITLWPSCPLLQRSSSESFVPAE